jgi:hypothetical protein
MSRLAYTSETVYASLMPRCVRSDGVPAWILVYWLRGGRQYD